MVYKSNSATDTQKIAAEIAEEFRDKGGVISLVGDLGAGKTTFTQGFAKALNINDKVISPTFVLMRQHQVPNSEKRLFHIDLYRLEGEINPKELGLDELFAGDDIILIEWAEKIDQFLPKRRLNISFEKVKENERNINALWMSE